MAPLGGADATGLYTKAVLTIIALALTGIFATSLVTPNPVSAQSPADYSRLQVSATGNQVVVYNNFDGNIEVLDLNSGRHRRSWHIGDPAVSLSGGN
jgi:hypothetical protein